MATTTVTRRACSFGLLSLPFVAHGSLAQNALPNMIVNKDPSCGCCGSWMAYLRANGFSVAVIETNDIDRIKARLGVPSDLASCHTAEIGGYVVEGHVPHTTIRRLLAERPQAIGIALPGMPPSAPGMDTPGARDIYDVILFGPSSRRRYARFQGQREL